MRTKLAVNEVSLDEIVGLAPGILLIDDDKDYLERSLFMIKNLKGEHYSVDTASDGNIGINKVISRSATKPYDVIFSDCTMPDIDGTQVLERLRGIGISTPYVFITSKTESELGKARNLADGYISKTDFSLRPELILKYLP